MHRVVAHDSEFVAQGWQAELQQCIESALKRIGKCGKQASPRASMSQQLDFLPAADACCH